MKSGTNAQQSMTTATTAQWLTAQLRFDREPGVPVDPLPPHLTWEGLVWAAEQHGLAGFLRARLDAQTLAALPSQARALLEVSRLEKLVSNALHYQELGRWLDRFSAEQIPVIILKGAALGVLLYERTDLRPMMDIDLLVPRADFSRAAKLLLDGGYVSAMDEFQRDGDTLRCELEFSRTLAADTTVDKRLLQRAGFDNDVLPAALGVASPGEQSVGETKLRIDLHWHLVNATFYASHVPIAWFWERTTEVNVDGHVARVFSIEAQLLHLCSHHAFHHANRGLVWLYDIAGLIHRFGQKIDWDSTIDAAQRFEWGQSLAVAIHQAQETFGVVVPRDVTVRLARLRATDRERLTQALAGNLSSVLINGWHETGFWRRLRYWLHFLWPPPEYMRTRYHVFGRRQLLVSHLCRIARGIYRVPQDLLYGAVLLLKQGRR